MVDNETKTEAPSRIGTEGRRDRIRTDQDSTLAAAAVTYAQNGFAVLPLLSGAKVPATRHGHHDATTNAHEVRYWWTEHPDHNIGLRPYVGVVVLDVDPRNGGDATLQQWIAEAPLPRTGPKARTRDRGWHLWYRLPGGVELCDKPGSGIEVKSNKGYVVVPPSRVPDDNGQPSGYRWVRPLIGRPIPELPQPWIQHLSKQIAMEHKIIGPIAAAGTNPAYVAAAIDSELRGLAETRQKRNIQLNKAAFAVFGFVKGGHADQGLIYQELTRIAQAIGLTDSEIRATLKSAWGKAVAREVPTQ